MEAGYANECSADQLAAAITSRTAAILLHQIAIHCVQKNMLSVEQAAVVVRKHDLPLIVDAAAEEDLHTYYRSGPTAVRPARKRSSIFTSGLSDRQRPGTLSG